MSVINIAMLMSELNAECARELIDIWIHCAQRNTEEPH